MLKQICGYSAFAFADPLTLTAAAVVVTVTGTEYSPLTLRSTILHNPYSSPNKAISMCRGAKWR